MPSPAIPRTIKDYTFYYYAKLVIAPSAGFKDNYSFIIDTYRKLKDGLLQFSDYERELELLSNPSCIICNSKVKTYRKLIPIKDRIFMGQHNLVPVCEKCDDSWGDYDFITWWCDIMQKRKETIPRSVVGAFLKMTFEYHHINFTLDKRCNSLLDLAKSLYSSQDNNVAI